MTQKLTSGLDSKRNILDGLHATAEKIASTIGPEGRVVVVSKIIPVEENGRLVGKRFNLPTKDGVTVAREIVHSDIEKEIGGDLVKQASGRTVEDAGDGTSAAAVLLDSLATKGFEAMEKDPNLSPYDLKRGIEMGCSEVVSHIRSIKKPIEGDRLTQIATISCNNDADLGSAIAQVAVLVGTKGDVEIRHGKSNTTTFTHDRGYRIFSGMVTELMKDERSPTCDLENPYIFMFEETVNQPKHLALVVNMVLEKDPKAQFLFIAKGFNKDVVDYMMVNRETWKSAAIKIPNVGTLGDNIMRDIAFLTGGTYVVQEGGIGINPELHSEEGRVEITHLGRCESVTVALQGTLLKGFVASEEAIQDRVETLEKERDQNEDLAPFYQKRIAALTGSVATIYVGGITESEINEKMYRVDDALRACVSAMEEGYVVGAGMVYMQLQPHLKQMHNAMTSNVGEAKGFEILMESIKRPYSQILKNAGLPEDKKTNFKDGMGYNAKTRKIENLEESGVIDPAKVLISSLSNAVSAAGMFYITDGVVLN